ncbi:MAG: hypothetical protein K0R69_2268 [Clostridia bacterium]|nr:hypothetical protein [Clostridia bacterium]
MTKLTKKVMSLSLAAAMLVVPMAGCTSKEADTQAAGGEVKKEESADSSAKAEGGKLVVWGGVAEESGPGAIVTEWNEKHPDTPVEYVRYVNDDTGNTKLDTALLSGEQIDVFFTYSADLLKKRVDSKMVEDLSNLNAEEFINSQIYGGVEGILKPNDGLYAIPTAREPIGLMINKDMLDEKGITIPEDWTMDQFVEIAAQLTGEKDGKKVYGTCTYYDGLPLGLPQTLLGGNYLYKADGTSNFDDAIFRTNTKLKEMMDNGSAIPYEEVFSRKLERFSHPAFLNEEIAMMPFASWMLRYVNDPEFPHDFITTFAPIPRVDENTENPYQSILNNYVSINSNSQNKEKAWEFVQFWATEGAKHIAKMPAYNAFGEEEEIKLILGENPEQRFDVEAYKKVMLDPSLKYVVATETTALPEVMQIYKEESEKYFLGATKEEDYYGVLKSRADDVISKAKK